MKITPFHPSHIGAIRPNSPAEREIVENAPRQYLELLAAETSFTWWVNGRPVACAGVQGDCELWAVFDESCARIPVTLLKETRKFIAGRGWLYANVAPGGIDRVRACRLLEHLGFVECGRRTVAGETRIRYERAA